MTRFVDLFTEADSVLHRLDPRVKIIGVVMLSLLALMIGGLVYLLALAALMVLLLLLGRASLSKTMFAFTYVFRVMILIVVLWPIFDPGGATVLLELGPLKITWEGILDGIGTAIRVFCLAAVWYILMFTTSQRDLVRALVKLGLRFDFGLSLAISLRFLPTFGATVESIKDAQRARGLELDKGSVARRARNYLAVLVPTTVSALRTADTLSLALQSRAYGARTDRTYLRALAMRPVDYAALVVVAAAFVVPFTVKYLFAFAL